MLSVSVSSDLNASVFTVTTYTFVIYNEIEWGQCFLDHTDFHYMNKKQVKYSLNNLKRKLYRF